MRRLAVMLGVGLLAGCANDGPAAVNMRLSDGWARVQPHPSDRHLVMVQMLNWLDIGTGWTPDRAADRRSFVRTLLSEQCGEPVIEDAQVTLTGSPQAVRQFRTYTLTVRCPKGASTPVER